MIDPISLLFGFVVGSASAGGIAARFHRKQFNHEEELHNMTVAQVKQAVLDARTDIKAKVVEESAEVKLLVQGNAGGATPTQLDEIGAEVNALRDEALVEIGKISDNAAGNPEPEPGPTA